MRKLTYQEINDVAAHMYSYKWAVNMTSRLDIINKLTKYIEDLIEKEVEI